MLDLISKPIRKAVKVKKPALETLIKDMDKHMEGAMYGKSDHIHFRRAYSCWQKIKKIV